MEHMRACSCKLCLNDAPELRELLTKHAYTRRPWIPMH